MFFTIARDLERPANTETATYMALTVITYAVVSENCTVDRLEAHLAAHVPLPLAHDNATTPLFHKHEYICACAHT